jgi:hypothetical protein
MTPEEQATADAAAAKPDPAVEIARLTAELTASKATAAEKNQAAEFWYAKANAKPEEKKEAATEEEVDLLELIGKGGKNFEAWLDKRSEKRGYMSREDVEKLVQQKSVQLIKENQLVDRYPDLKDKASDFFKATSAEYIALKKLGVGDAIAMEMAAEKVELAELRSGKRKIKSKEDEESDRLDRVRAQGGDRNRRTPADRDRSDTLTAEDKAMIKRFGISEDSFKASRKTMVIEEGADKRR